MGPSFRRTPQLGIGSALFLFACLTHAQDTSQDLWEQYAAQPNTHPNVPNNSYAGYGYGEVPLPEITGPIFDVTEAPFSADNTGASDATEAIQSAVTAAGDAGGGVVFLPGGHYRIQGLIHLNRDGVVLRGAGPDATFLDFQNSLEQVVGPLGSGSSAWSWSGGLLWVSPDDTFDASGDLVVPGGFQGYERWRDTETVAQVVGTALRGDFSVQVDSAAELMPGQMVLLSFAMPGDSDDDDSFAKHVYGDPETVEDFDWAGADWMRSSQFERVEFPVRVASIDGNAVTFKEPLRTDIIVAWEVKIDKFGSVITESGIEDLRVVARAPSSQAGHNQYDGHNGIYVNRGYNLWIRNVAIENTENGLITSAVKGVTVSGLEITGSAPQHHSIATRVGTVDCLFEDFAVEGPSNVWHGINTEGFSAGNVFSRGYMERGTFDSHRLLPFDFIRTEIEMANDAAGAAGPADPGGSGDAGPFSGARAVHWNVDIFGTDRAPEMQGIWVLHPTQFPMGALVGVQGAPVMPTDPSDPHFAAWGVPDSGASGSLVVDVGSIPEPANLYEAQLALRLGDAVPPPDGGSGGGAPMGTGGAPDGSDGTGGAAATGGGSSAAGGGDGAGGIASAGSGGLGSPGAGGGTPSDAQADTEPSEGCTCTTLGRGRSPWAHHAWLLLLVSLGGALRRVRRKVVS